jgi:hypothetical protein
MGGAIACAPARRRPRSAPRDPPHDISPRALPVLVIEDGALGAMPVGDALLGAGFEVIGPASDGQAVPRR